MKKALVIGINHYLHCTPLHGCVNDANSVFELLDRNQNGTKNFTVKLQTSAGPSNGLNRNSLRASIEELFKGDSEISLLYFAGHGHIDSVGGYLVTSDSESGNDGVSLAEIVGFANKSEAKNRIIVLDSCHSGIAGSSANTSAISELKEGTTILTASSSEQYASEKKGAGVFTTLLVDALRGAACNLVGEITPGSVYAHIDQSLGPWDQRPIFKTNVKTFVSLRTVDPPISFADLRRIAEFFPNPNHEFKLDPEFEPERSAGQSLPPPDPKKNAVFAVLQKYNRVNLLVPVGAQHMWHAAINNKSCRLTPLGEHYRRLVVENRI